MLPDLSGLPESHLLTCEAVSDNIYSDGTYQVFHRLLDVRSIDRLTFTPMQTLRSIDYAIYLSDLWHAAQ